MDADFLSTGARYKTENPSFSVNGANSEDRSLDMLKSKRFSIGALGDFSDHFPSTSLHGIGDEGNKFGTKSFKVNSKKPSVTKGRRDSLGLLSSSFFDDYVKFNRRSSLASVTMNRRSSMSSVGTFASTGMVGGDDDDDDDMERSEVRFSQSIKLTPLLTLPLTCPTSQQRTSSHVQPQTQPNALQALPMLYSRPVPLHNGPMHGLMVPEMNHVMEAFCGAMSQSHKSQQAIHDWDRKMGLKRSHSKTMRLTMRSRKKLKSMLKKQCGKISTH